MVVEPSPRGTGNLPTFTLTMHLNGMQTERTSDDPDRRPSLGAGQFCPWMAGGGDPVKNHHPKPGNEPERIQTNFHAFIFGALVHPQRSANWGRAPNCWKLIHVSATIPVGKTNFRTKVQPWSRCMKCLWTCNYREIMVPELNVIYFRKFRTFHCQSW